MFACRVYDFVIESRSAMSLLHKSKSLRIVSAGGPLSMALNPAHKGKFSPKFLHVVKRFRFSTILSHSNDFEYDAAETEHIHLAHIVRI